MEPTLLWKIGLAVGLGTAIIASASVRAPRKPLARSELRWPVLGALALYAAGLFALLQHRGAVAIWLFAAGIVTSSLAAWLSRARDGGGWPQPGDDPVDEHPPENPDGVPGFDWASFEREFRAYSGSRGRDPVSSR